MKLESQVVSLDIAKKLKELGVKQESCFAWVDHTIDGTSESLMLLFIGGKNYKKMFSAFTVAELGEMLQEEESELPTYLSSTGEWVAVYETTLIGGATTEADARGKMLIYLIENNLISLT